MKDTNTSDALQGLLSTCVFPGQDARRLPATLALACEALRRANASFVLVGRAALARYCPAQFTNRLVFRVADVQQVERGIGDLKAELAAPPFGAAEIDLRFENAVCDGERRIMTSVPSTPWLRARVPVAAPEHLLWLACLSSRADDLWDAENVLRSGHVEWGRFLDLAGSDTIVRLRGDHARREAERVHPSFSDVWERRLNEGREPPVRGRR